MQRTLMIEYGDDLLVGLGLSPDEFSKEARFLLAAKLYELGRLTSGQGARLAAMNRVEFLLSLTRAGIPVSDLPPDDADVETEFARRG